MADNNDIKETGDSFKDIEAKTRQLLENTVDFEEAIRESNKAAINLQVILEAVVKKSSNLPKGIKDANGLLEAMKKNAGLFNDVQKEGLRIAQQQVKDTFLPSVKIQDEILKSAEEMLERNKGNVELEQVMLKAQERKNSLVTKFADEMDRVSGDTKDQFKNLKDSLEVQKEANEEMFDTKKILDDLGTKIRNPAQVAEGFLGTLSQIPKKLVKARQEGKSMGVALSEAFNLKAIREYAKFLANPMVLAIVAVTAVLLGLFKLFKNYYEFLDKNIMPAQADFNKELGNTGKHATQLKGQAAAMGVQFELLGLGFAEGAKLVRDFAGGMQSVEPFDRETMLAAENLVGVLGMGGDAAGKFALQFQKQDGNLKMLHKTMVQAEKDANAYGIPVAMIQKDLAESPNILARFGTAAAMEFEKSALKARTLGLGIKEVNQAFGDQMDTFEGTSDAAAKLNAIFGTNINSMELMMETDPTKRMMMLREELVAQGKSWNDLNAFEKNMISTTMKMDKSQVALMLGSEKERRTIEAKAAARKRDEATNAKWNRGITRMQRTLIAWGKEIDKTMRNITKLIAAIFGVEKPGKIISNMTKKLKGFFGDLNLSLKEATDWFRELHKDGFSLSDMFVTATKGALAFLGTIAEMLGFTGLSEWFGGFYRDLDQLTDMDWGLVWKGFKMTVSDMLSDVGSFFKKWLFDEPKKLIQELISWVTENGPKIMKAIIPGADMMGEGLDAIKKWFSSGEGKPSKNVDDALIKKSGEVIQFNSNDDILAATNLQSRLAGSGAASGGGKEDVEITLTIEGTDELAEALAKIISVKQIKRARTI